MLNNIHPKLPMRNKIITKNYYVNKLGFTNLGDDSFKDYLMIKKDAIEIHFFIFENLNPKENYGQVYISVNEIEKLYENLIANKITIHPNASLQLKPWGQKEFSLLDPDNNLLTFGESV